MRSLPAPIYTHWQAAGEASPKRGKGLLRPVVENAKVFHNRAGYKGVLAPRWQGLLAKKAWTERLAQHIRFIQRFLRYAPRDFHMTAWLTWYYKNCPSVIRGWRSSQNACIQFLRKGCHLHPEHFLNEAQKEKFATGKMRFVPGPSSVIESPLIIGFVGKKEKTGHPSQKPEAVFDKLLLMALAENQIVFDPMAGSGTTGASAVKNGFGAILCDREKEYISMMEKRLQVRRISI